MFLSRFSTDHAQTISLHQKETIVGEVVPLSHHQVEGLVYIDYWSAFLFLLFE